MPAAPHLKVVRGPSSNPSGTDTAPDLGDLAFVALLFVVNLVPIGGELTGVGTWSPAIVGFAAAVALLTGRELWCEVRARMRRR